MLYHKIMIQKQEILFFIFAAGYKLVVIANLGHESYLNVEL